MLKAKYLDLMLFMQVFPLLLQQFSSKEQASLVWQFICSVPVILLEDFFPWMISFLSPDEHVSVVHCIEQVVPKEKYLQEVYTMLNSCPNLNNFRVLMGRIIYKFE